MDGLWVTSATVCFLAMLAGLASASWGILLARRRGRWQSSQATVIGHGSRMATSGPPSYYPATSRHAIARYIDLQGEDRTLEVPEQSTGSAVPILIDPRRPGHACVDKEFGPVGFPVFLVIAAVAGLLLYLIPWPWTTPP